MKTKVRTLIAILALGTIGFTNINAIADHKRVGIAEFAIEKEEMLTIESWMIDTNYWTSKTVVDTLETEDSLQVESWMLDKSIWE